MTMKHLIFCLQFGLICLLLAACGSVTASPPGEPGATEIKPLSTVSVAEQNPDPTASAAFVATSIPEAVASETLPAATVPATAAPAETPLASSGIPPYGQGNDVMLVLPGCFDFDGGVSLAPPDPACDFNLLPGPDSGTIQVYPIETAQLAYGGVFPEAPTPAQCAQNPALSAEPEVVAPLAAMYVCYRTGEGRAGYLHFTGADLAQAGAVTFDWVTFAEENGAEPAPNGSHTGTDLVYRNDAFDFQFTLPATWAGFQTTAHDDDNGTNLCFHFGGSQPFCILKIDVWSKAAWNNLEMIPDGYYLAENAEFVFAAGPYQSRCVQLDDFQCERRQEVPGILAGFAVAE